ncbi:MAG: choice-of-anchor D domain-containing protein [Pseudomonadota bacterium]|nr:choice-of-anchor D domain-containing protein [Pseudomonadota bacterium]
MTASLLLLVACVGLEPIPGRDTDPAAADDTGGGSSTVGGLEIDASSIAFGTVELGGTVERDLVLTNTGATPLEVALELDGDAFELSTAAVQVETDAVVTLTFAPATEGPYEGTLSVTVDGGDTLAIPLTGTGEAPDEPEGPVGNISITPTRYNFGQVDVDTTTTTTFTVSNTGDEDVLISDVVTSAGVWTTGGTLSPPQVLSPGSNKLLEVSFTPGAETTYTGTVTIESDDPDSPTVDIEVEGEGVDFCDICSPLIDVDTGADPYAITDFFSLFGSTDSRTITIQNIGDMDLTVSSVVVNNDALATCGSFTVGGWGSAETLTPYQTASFTLSYRATESCLEVAQAGFDANVVHILSNDPSENDWVIELSGAAI